MLGFRGCRLAIRYPEITEMQARAIFEAAVSAAKKTGKPVVPEVMIPLIAYRREFDILRDVIVKTAQAVEKETGAKLDYQIGTMIELPRAALKADEIAAGEAGAEFFSFGTNDLTQTCLGLSRDDAAPILANYAQRAIFEVDPFVSIDQDGVGELVRIGTERGPQGAARPQGRHLRRARRRSGLDRRSATRPASTTCPARPSACRSRALPPRRRPSGRRARAEPVDDQQNRDLYRFGSPACVIGLVEEIVAGVAAMLAPAREGVPLLGRQAVGNLDVEVLHRLPRPALGLRLARLCGQERLLIERLGDEGLDRLLARGAHLAAEGADVPALLGRRIPQLLAARGRERAGIAEQVGGDGAGPAAAACGSATWRRRPSRR